MNPPGQGIRGKGRGLGQNLFPDQVLLQLINGWAVRNESAIFRP